jgi:4-alpha-glucanotransferase
MKSAPEKSLPALRRLARLKGVQTSYLAMSNERREASPESLLTTLRALEVPVAHPGDVPAALLEAQQERARRVVEPVQIAWQGKRAVVPVQLPERSSTATVRCQWRLEKGDVRRSEFRLEHLPIQSSTKCAGENFVTRAVPVPAGLPAGFHRVVIECGPRRMETHLICAPEKCFAPAKSRREWGVFAPLYALHSERSWGAGDFGDLSEFLRWVGGQGGSFAGTLPLLPAYLQQPLEPSPYSPVSRLFWNEFYLDVAQIPELKNCPAARRLMRSLPFQNQLQTLRSAPLVDYAAQMTLKRGVLERLSRAFFAETSPRRRVFEQFLHSRPQVLDYARFRAVQEQRGEPWTRWPERLRNGELREGDGRRDVERYHLYVQWLAQEQMSVVAQTAKADGVALYLDLPLGTHRDGYDSWRHQNIFALATSGGAPPDPVFTQGQNWGFAPLHPQRSREQGHAYFAECVRHHLRHAGMLRLDHVMGLHRLYWAPNDRSAAHGAYVSYPAEEFYAILSIESHRHRAVIVGEDLGTVPREVNRSLKRHRIAGMFVGQYEFRPPPKPVLRPVPASVVASLNTHDMPPFEAWLEALDIADRRELGLLKPTEVPRELQARKKILRALIKRLRQRRKLGHSEPGIGAVSRALLAHLAASPARWELVNLEDLWSETLAQNVPGTSTERINWRRKARLSLEQLQHDPSVLEQLRFVHQLRKGKPRRRPRRRLLT